eukprot:scaffold116780_cov63-Phaeocystis_antarctica.AAC.1
MHMYLQMRGDYPPGRGVAMHTSNIPLLCCCSSTGSSAVSRRLAHDRFHFPPRLYSCSRQTAFLSTHAIRRTWQTRCARTPAQTGVPASSSSTASRAAYAGGPCRSVDLSEAAARDARAKEDMARWYTPSA